MTALRCTSAFSSSAARGRRRRRRGRSRRRLHGDDLVRGRCRSGRGPPVPPIHSLCSVLRPSPTWASVASATKTRTFSTMTDSSLLAPTGWAVTAGGRCRQSAGDDHHRAQPEWERRVETNPGSSPGSSPGSGDSLASLQAKRRPRVASELVSSIRSGECCHLGRGAEESRLPRDGHDHRRPRPSRAANDGGYHRLRWRQSLLPAARPEAEAPHQRSHVCRQGRRRSDGKSDPSRRRCPADDQGGSRHRFTSSR